MQMTNQIFLKIMQFINKNIFLQLYNNRATINKNVIADVRGVN